MGHCLEQCILCCTCFLSNKFVILKQSLILHTSAKIIVVDTVRLCPVCASGNHDIKKLYSSDSSAYSLHRNMSKYQCFPTHSFLNITTVNRWAYFLAHPV